MGAGAVGCYFGGMLARAGADVTLIARGAHLDALVRDGLFLDSIHFQEAHPVRATDDPAGVSGAELVLFCVKTTGTAEAAQSHRPASRSRRAGAEHAERRRQRRADSRGIWHRSHRRRGLRGSVAAGAGPRPPRRPWRPGPRQFAASRGRSRKLSSPQAFPASSATIS